MYRPVIHTSLALFVLSGCQTVDGEKGDISNGAQQAARPPASAAPKQATHQGRETDPIKQQINAHVDPVSKRNSEELTFAYDQFKPKFSARMRQLRDKHNLAPQKYDVLLTIGNDGDISDCEIRNGGPGATAEMRGDMCYAWSWVFFGKKIPSLPPYKVAIQTPIPDKQAQAPQTALTVESTKDAGTNVTTHKVELVGTAKAADTGKTSQPATAPVPARLTPAPAAPTVASAAPSVAPSTSPTAVPSTPPSVVASVNHQTSHQFELSPPTQ